MIAGAPSLVAVAILAVTSETLSERHGLTGLLIGICERVWTAFTILFGSPTIAMFWIGIGVAIGAVLQSQVTLQRERAAGRLGGRSHRVLRFEARWIRRCLRSALLARISGDLSADLALLNDDLVNRHRLPPLPTTSPSDVAALPDLSEFLREVETGLRPGRTDELRERLRLLDRQRRRRSGRTGRRPSPSASP